MRKKKTPKLKNLPKVGEFYHFWDDGKTGPNRHYMCKVERIIPISEANQIMFNNINDNNQTSLLDFWISEKTHCDWLYAPQTDYFIEASCPTYDVHYLWFARTLDGGFFSMDIQSGWQSGRLDVDGKIFEDVVDYWTDQNQYELVETYKNCTYYKK